MYYTFSFLSLLKKTGKIALMLLLFCLFSFLLWKGMLFLTNQIRNDIFSDILRLQPVAGISTFLAMIMTVFLFHKLLDREHIRNLGLAPYRMIINILVGILFCVAMLCSGFIIIIILTGSSFSVIAPHRLSLLISAGVFLLSAFTEEIIFRGYVLRNFLSVIPKFLALLFSSCIYAALHACNAHFGWIALGNTVLLGMFLGISYIYTQNLWLPIALNWSWNFVQGFFGFSVSGDSFNNAFIHQNKFIESFISGGSYGFEGSIVASALLIAGILLQFFYFRNRELEYNTFS
jgi:membrane protease YdiL (CAAX protease family)